MTRTIGLILGVPIDAVSWPEALDRIFTWSSSRESRVVCICNVHSVVTASKDRTFGAAVSSADMATPDGAPIAWMLRRAGYGSQERINGPDLMWRFCEELQNRSKRSSPGDRATDVPSVFLYGASETTLSLLLEKLRATFPDIQIAGAISPPFGKLTSEQDAAFVDQINASGAGVVFISLGCPKQELWMAEHRGRIRAAMVGVGAAFDYHAGTLKRAPLWMQKRGLEWLHRLASEPRRLWRRYLVTNTWFIAGAARQLLLSRVNLDCSNQLDGGPPLKR